MAESQVFEGLAGSAERLDVFAAGLAGITRSRAGALVKAGLVTADGAAQTKAGFMLRPGTAVRVTVPEVLQPYIARLQDGPRGWWLPALHHGSKDGTTAVVNRGLRKWAERNGVKPFTFGAARHSWASIARQKAKVEKATVDECLVHVGEFRITDIYAERAWDLLDEANEKVLALFRWPSGRSPLLLDSEE